MEKLELTSTVVSILAKYAEHDVADISDDTPVFGVEGVIADSINILDALCDIEASLGVSIPDEDLTEELFSSISTLVSYLSSRINAN